MTLGVFVYFAGSNSKIRLMQKVEAMCSTFSVIFLILKIVRGDNEYGFYEQGIETKCKKAQLSLKI